VWVNWTQCEAFKKGFGNTCSKTRQRVNSPLYCIECGKRFKRGELVLDTGRNGLLAASQTAVSASSKKFQEPTIKSRGLSSTASLEENVQNDIENLAASRCESLAGWTVLRRHSDASRAPDDRFVLTHPNEDERRQTVAGSNGDKNMVFITVLMSDEQTHEQSQSDIPISATLHQLPRSSHAIIADVVKASEEARISRRKPFESTDTVVRSKSKQSPPYPIGMPTLSIQQKDVILCDNNHLKAKVNFGVSNEHEPNSTDQLKTSRRGAGVINSPSCFTQTLSPERPPSIPKRSCVSQRRHPERKDHMSQLGSEGYDRQSIMTTMSYFKDQPQQSESTHRAVPTMNTSNNPSQSPYMTSQSTIRAVTAPLRAQGINQQERDRKQTPSARSITPRMPLRQQSNRTPYDDAIDNKRRYNLQMENDPQYEKPSPDPSASKQRQELLRTQSERINYETSVDDGSPSRSYSRHVTPHCTSKNPVIQYNNGSPLLDLKEHQNKYVNSLPRDEEHERQWSTTPATPTRFHSQSTSITVSQEARPYLVHARTDSEVSVKRFSVFDDISKLGLLPFYTDGSLDPARPIDPGPPPPPTYEVVPVPPIPESPPKVEPIKGLKKTSTFKSLLRRKLAEPKQRKGEGKRQEQEAKKAKVGEARRLKAESMEKQAVESEGVKQEHERAEEVQKYVDNLFYLEIE